MDKSPVPSLTREAFNLAISESNFWGLALKWSRTPSGKDCGQVADAAEDALFRALAAGSPSTVPSDQPPVAQRPEASKETAPLPADATVAPQERLVSNRRQSEDSPPEAACVLASAPGDPSEHSGTAVLRPAPSSEPPVWAVQLAAQAWCEPETSHIFMDDRLAFVFAQMLAKLAASFERDRASEPDASPSPTEPPTRSAGEGST